MVMAADERRRNEEPSFPPAPEGVLRRAATNLALGWKFIRFINESQRLLLVGFGLMGAIFLLEVGVDSSLMRAAEDRAWTEQRDAIRSIEQVNRIDRDLDQERILVDDHINDDRPEQMAMIEREIADIGADLRGATETYGPLITQPGEAEVWREVQREMVRFNKAVGEALAHSRKMEDAEARATMTTVRDDYMSLKSDLLALVQVNGAGALSAMNTIQAQRCLVDNVVLGMRLAGLLLVMLLASWLVWRVGSYEKKITGYTRLLEQRNSDLDAFAGRVAHDLRNVMGPIVMAPPMLRQAAADPKLVLDIADRTERCSGRVTGVLDSLLAFSRASGSVQEHERGALRTAVKNVMEDIAPLIAKLDVSAKVEEIPEVSVRCDPGLLHIVLANLVGNAVKYLEGREERRVSVSARRDDECCRIDVEDTGPGIPRRAQAMIFEPFYRVKGTRVAGTGIGLATVRRIVEARGGRIEVKSTEGCGSRFSVWLPLADPD